MAGWFSAAPPTEGGGGGVQLPGGQVGSGEVAAFVVVVLDVERAQFGEINPEGAAAVVDVLPVQRLKHSSVITRWLHRATYRSACSGVVETHSLGVLGVDGVAELDQSLELVVPGEGDDLEDGAELTEDLSNNNYR